MVWMSICSRHQVRDSDCPTCDRGREVSQEQLDAEHALYELDYRAWYRQANGGKSPSEDTVRRYGPKRRIEDVELPEELGGKS